MTDANQQDRTGHAADGVRDRAAHVYESARTKAEDAVDASRERAADAARRTADAIETNPVGVLVGGLALGAVVAAVLPRSQREKDLLAPIGKRVGLAATAALAAAKEAGRGELDGVGVSRSAAKDQARSLLDGVIKAASAAGTAAVDAGKDAMRTR